MSCGRPVLTGSRRLFRATVQPRRHAINGRRFNLAIEGPPPALAARAASRVDDQGQVDHGPAAPSVHAR
jgi:hypothetical protein